MRKIIWNLIPNKQIGELKFGESKKSIHNILGKEYKTFRKSIFTKSTTDDYSDYHIYYTPEGLLEAVEIFENIEVKLNGEKLFPGTIEEAKKVISDLECDADSYISLKNSIGLYAPNDDGIIEAILIAKEGYYI